MDIPCEIITKSPQETQSLGAGIGHRIKLQLERRGEKCPTIVCLYGELGSGKTTFVQGFAKGIGLLRTRLLSPTFIIVRRYELLPKPFCLYHVDLYRIEDSQSIHDLGLLETFVNPSAIVAIEWAEKLGSLLPEKRIDIRFTALSDGSHKIFIQHEA
ncbi:tRNA (adenosine(37)-N6)-threonylcarbamoyltransferase complex ATPase subunit type 1 TsaE [Patescibacteria group bacterium]|nr:tRNA (adenosine(37)-N6)-threonylcarbamoyltransferase complex ATPase subunit type 1 TsaE [Patescibacteria group bacterium]MBU1472727.1 tRNA (adenosine(37)-N6)-threonylcarbamoyltransferase complex ATPase subunit type 1 TsaE [Patescibacteria group bacterium]MBU2459994.1 tRNA (adenosine(37)-N6)-threonylcarbamoyltransferase complex ATPase subunit type 1 TsaE [Patescibacteria group bacterium]MBU2544348.1 tRNA (adenosine(37)-N6)-threonylcarbamoyltransferase complex ATPase subunit type 1 TsaE [Patesc